MAQQLKSLSRRIASKPLRDRFNAASKKMQDIQFEDAKLDVIDSVKVVVELQHGNGKKSMIRLQDDKLQSIPFAIYEDEKMVVNGSGGINEVVALVNGT